MTKFDAFTQDVIDDISRDIATTCIDYRRYNNNKNHEFYNDIVYCVESGNPLFFIRTLLKNYNLDDVLENMTDDEKYNFVLDVADNALDIIENK